jgi:hypothetical protein
MKKAHRDQIRLLQAHIDRNYKRWFKRYANLQGVEVGLKKVADKPVADCYSIVFHVTAKSHKTKKKVPKQLPVTKPDGRRSYMPTDVIEAGELKLQGIKMGDSTKNSRTNLVGTISFYFKNPRGVFVCSNMHVLAPHLLDRGIISYDRRTGSPAEKVLLFDNVLTATGDLLRARFNGIDIAFARVDNPLIPQVIEFLIKSAGPVKGVLDLNESNVSGARLSFFGRTSKLQPCRAISLRGVKATEFRDVFLTNLIKMEPCTQDGDSGAPVFDQRNRVVGIIIGRDNESSYAMHINDIIQFYQDSKF